MQKRQPDRDEMLRLIRMAVERGVTFFDTAESYGARSLMRNWSAKP